MKDNMEPLDLKFENEKQNNIEAALANQNLFMQASKIWMLESGKYNYTYNFSWFGVPIIQFPQDIISLQELVFENKPDVIIETGVARGGSVIFSASLLALLDLRESLDLNISFKQNRKVIGIDIDIREHTIKAIENESLRSYIELINGSSIDTVTHLSVSEIVKDYLNPMILLDSNHTESHVIAELEFYSTLVKSGGYIIVYDTSIEFDSEEFWNSKDRSWGPGNSPLSALKKFLISNSDFEIVYPFCPR